jgi:hypothetical protein
MREAVDKRQCQAVTAAGKPCKAAPLSGEQFCMLHHPDADPAALGRIGGSARGRRGGAGNGGGRGGPFPSGSGPDQNSGDRRSRLAAAFDRELDIAETTGTIRNLQGFVALARAVLERTDDESRRVSVVEAREMLLARLKAGGVQASGEKCPVCKGRGYVERPSGPVRHTREIPEEPAELVEAAPPPVAVDGPQGGLRPDIRQLDPARFEQDIVRRQRERGVSVPVDDDAA